MLLAATVRRDGYISTRRDNTVHHTATHPSLPHHRSDICPAAPTGWPGVDKAMSNASRAGLRDSKPWELQMWGPGGTGSGEAFASSLSELGAVAEV